MNSYKPRYFMPLSHCPVVELVITVSGFLIIVLISRLMVTSATGQCRIMPRSLMTELISWRKMGFRSLFGSLGLVERRPHQEVKVNPFNSTQTL